MKVGISPGAPFPGSRHCRSRAAFSLFELMAVIAVALVLGALIHAVTQRVFVAGQRARSVSNLRGIGLASLNYANEHNGHLPPNGTLAVKASTVGYGLSSSSGPPRYLFSREETFGAAEKNYGATPDQFYSPFASAYKQRDPGKFYTTNGKTALIGYLFFYLPRISANDRDLGEGFYNDTVRETANCPLYSDFCISTRDVAGFTDASCHVLYLGGHVRHFDQRTVAARGSASWTYVIRYFRNP
ncbi:MAG TPA: hypothetical protein VNQ90_09555 [Chthoniobacteraceae bacterium]|nr:hypothetical protein [Chthoniobacteraceae bacterium]